MIYSKFLFYLLNFVFIFSFFPDGSPKDNLSGTWEGILIQNYEPVRIYKFKMILNQNGNTISGSSRIEYPNSIFFGEMNLSGTFKKDKFTFKEKKIVNQKTGIDWTWCLKSGTLIFNSSKDSLSGKWEGCDVPGTIKLHRIKSK
jgi:hypothetical protein